MTDTFEQKKIEEFEKKFVDNKNGSQWWQTNYDYPSTATPERVKSFLLETIRQARIEGAKERDIQIYNKVQKEANKYMLDPLFPQVKYAITEILLSVFPESKRIAHSDTKEKEEK